MTNGFVTLGDRAVVESADTDLAGDVPEVESTFSMALPCACEIGMEGTGSAGFAWTGAVAREEKMGTGATNGEEETPEPLDGKQKDAAAVLDVGSGWAPVPGKRRWGRATSKAPDP